MNLEQAAERLASGDGALVSVKVRGHSMTPRIKDGATVTIDPSRRPDVGDVVLARVRGRLLVHRVNMIVRSQGGSDDKYQITNLRGHVNGWASRVYGVVVRVT